MKLIEAVAVTYAAVGQELSDAALAMIAKDLSVYPAQGVAVALSRCRRELRRIALADILERIPGGRPGAEEAWSIVSPTLNDERVTVVWTTEMQQAFGVALKLQDDHIAARMAFKEAYTRLTAEAREAGAPIRWQASLGQDAAGRESVLVAAAEKGLLTVQHVAGLLPYIAGSDASLRLDNLKKEVQARLSVEQAAA